MREKLRSILEDNTSRYGKVFDYVIQVLILVSLISFSIETLPDLTPNVESFLSSVETFCVLVFTIEYLLRVYAAKNRLKYVFSFFGIIDLLAILPFFLSGAIDLRSIRAFRIFRVFRTLKLIRYNRALHRFNIAASIVKEEVVLFFMISGIIVFLSASGIYYFENEAQPEAFASIFHSAWWAIATLTTVGYGDVYPITLGGKIFTFFVLLVGIGIVTVPAGLVATSLSKARQIEERERKIKKSKSKKK